MFRSTVEAGEERVTDFSFVGGTALEGIAAVPADTAIKLEKSGSIMGPSGTHIVEVIPRIYSRERLNGRSYLPSLFKREAQRNHSCSHSNCVLAGTCVVAVKDDRASRYACGARGASLGNLTDGRLEQWVTLPRVVHVGLNGGSIPVFMSGLLVLVLSAFHLTGALGASYEDAAGRCCCGSTCCRDEAIRRGLVEHGGMKTVLLVLLVGKAAFPS